MRNFAITATLFLFLFAYNTALADTTFSGAIVGDAVWTKANGPYLINYVSIPAGASLTIEPGTIIKVADNSYPFIVDGTLTIGSTGGEQVVITSMKDDTVGGDTNGDGGVTTPNSGDWREMTFNLGSIGNMTNTTIRYGGSSVYNSWTGGYFIFPLIDNKGGTLTLTNVTLSKSGNNALEQFSGTTTITNSTISDLSRGVINYGGSLTIGNNTFSNLGDYGVSVYAATNFTNNGGNTGGRGIYMAYSISGNQTWAKDNIPYVANSISIPNGSSLTIAPGAIVKATTDSFPFYVDGTLMIGALSATENAIITSIKDDSIGGDTNNDGNATTPASGDWRKITMNAGANVTVAHATIKYGGATPYNSWTGGYFTYPLIENNGGVLSVSNSQLAQSGYFGILQNSGTTTIANSTLSNISKWGIYNTQGVLAVASTTFDTMERGIEISAGALELGGNTFTHISSYAVSLEGSYIALTNHAGNTGSTGLFLSQSISGSQTLPKDGLVYVVNYLSVPQGSTLTILPGAVVKIPVNGGAFSVDGTLTIGSSASDEKTYITSMNDDAVGGDTNGDATSTTPNSGDWRTITFNLGSQATISNTVIHYGGASPYNSWTGGADWLPAIKNNGGTLAFDHATLTNNGNFGILQLAGTTTIINSEVSHTSRYGLWMTGGTASINDSSIHDNATYGIYNGSTNIIDATNNWWGSATGPMHPSNSTGVGDKVSDYVNFGGWTGSDPTQGCIVNCNSNVLFLPGLEASRLYRPDYSGGTARLWEPEILHDNTEIFLDVNGIPNRSDIYTKDIIDNAYLPIKGNIYDSFIDSMDTMKSTGVINDWKAVPYDWRLSPDDILNNGNDINGHIYYSGDNAPTTTPYVIQELRRLAASSRTGKVTIIAHSNGGLVTKALTDKLGAEASSLIDQIIFVAVPQAGTPKAIGAILHGYEQGLPTDFAPFFINPEEARNLAKNMPSAYNLLPSASYFTYVDDEVVTFDNSALLAPWRARYGAAIHSGERLHTFIADQTRITLPIADELLFPISGNEALLNSAEVLHNTKLDSWTPPTGVQLTEIAGWGEKTLKTIEYYQGRKTSCTTPGDIHTCTDASALEYGVKEVMDGDGTVVVPSALWTSESTRVEKYWVNLDRYNNKLPWSLGHFGRKHADILEVPNLRMFIQSLITKSAAPLPEYISTATPTNDNPETRLHFALHSPLSLDLYDNLGNHTGISTTTGFLEENIPGSRYVTYGELKLIEAPASTTLHLVMNGYAVGSFTLDIAQEIGDVITASTTFAGIPTTADTVATMNFIDGTIVNASALSTDLDGDGTVDLALPPVVGDIVTLPVLKSPLTVTAENKTIILGSPIPELTATLSGFLVGDTMSSSVTGSPVCTITATTASPVGVYPITCTIGTLASQKYNFTTFVTGILTIQYKWSGFTQPINDVAYNSTQSASVFKGGSTIPVKFQLKNATGTSAQSKVLPVWLTPQKGSAMSASVDESIYSDPATSGSTFKWDSASQQYIYNWSTKGLATGYWYRIYAKLEDGTTQSVIVGLR